MNWKYIPALVLTLALATLAFSQGSIGGTVKDATTGEPIIGANVVIQDSQMGSPTDLDGKFLINNVPAGTYALQVSFITYKTHVLNSVIVENGKRTSIAIVLSEDVSELSEVVITGTRQMDNDFALISAIRESKLVVSGISSEMIIRTPDRDAAEVVKRIPGVTIMGGRFIVIRGLSERYNVSMLHGAYAPSMEADKRSFAFDIIPSAQLDQLLVFKSPSPELPGDFAGGVVKITTKGIPSESSVTFSYALGYRSGTTFGDFNQSSRSGVQYFGFNPGTNDLPANFPADVRLLDDNQKARAGRSLPNNWTPESTTAFLDQSASVTANFKFNIKRIKVGNITSVNLSHSRTRFDVGRQDFNEYDFTNNKPNPIYDYSDDQNNLNVRLGALFNWAFQFDENNTIEFKNLFNQINNSQYIFRQGQNFESNYYGTFGSFTDVYRGVYSGQLLGRHKLFDSKTKINWVANVGTSFRDMPDMRRYRRDIDLQNGNERTYVPVGAAQTYFLGRFYADMTEISYSGSVGIDHTFEISDSFLPVVSAGLFYEAKDRQFDARNLGYVRGNSWNSSLEFVPINELFQPQNINGTTGLQFDEQTNKSDAYSAQNNLLAYYASLSLPLGKFNLSGGVRIENNDQLLQSAQSTGEPIDQTVTVNRFLPSANLSYNFTDKMLVRATYGQTLNRPEFREIAPFGFFDFEYNLVISGNPNLKTAKINNYDFRWEWYPSKTEMITIGAFYKDFTNAIEMQFRPGGGSGGIKNFSFENAGSATNYGVEIDIRKSLDNLSNSPIVDKLNVLFNAALIKSEVNIEGQPTRQLMGQSPYVVNAGVYYNDEDKGWQISALYNVVGRRLFAVGGYTESGEVAYEDIYEMPRNVVDLSISKTFKQRLQLKLTVADILNQKFILMQDADRNGEFNTTADQIIQQNRFGSLYTFGVTYKVF